MSTAVVNRFDSFNDFNNFEVSTTDDSNDFSNLIKAFETNLSELKTKATKPELVEEYKDALERLSKQIKPDATTTVQSELLSASENLQEFVNFTRSFVFYCIRQYVTIVFFIIDSIHDNYGSRVKGLSELIHSITQEINKLNPVLTEEWWGLDNTAKPKESAAAFYNYLLKNSKIVRNSVLSMFQRFPSDMKSDDIKKKLTGIFKCSLHKEYDHNNHEKCVSVFLTEYTNHFTDKLSDASAKKVLNELMKHDKCGINITDKEIKETPLFKFLDTWDINTTALQLLVDFPQGDLNKNMDTAKRILTAQRIAIVRDVVASCQTDITDDVRRLSIKIREHLYEASGTSMSIADPQIDQELYDYLIKNGISEYIAKLHPIKINEEYNWKDHYKKNEKSLCCDLQISLFDLAYDHFNQKKCFCSKCGKMDFYTRYPIKRIEYKKLWANAYAVDNSETTLGWDVDADPDVKLRKKWRLDTYLGLLLTTRVLMSGTNSIDMKTSGYSTCVVLDNIAFVSGADFVNDESNLIPLVAQERMFDFKGKHLWLKSKNEMEALANTRYSVKTFQIDSGTILPTDCIKTGSKKDLKTNTIIGPGIRLSVNNTIKSSNVDPAIMLTFFCKMVETVSSAVQYDQAGTSTDDKKRQNMVLLYFFNGYTDSKNNMLKDSYDGILSGIDNFSSIMESWKSTLYSDFQIDGTVSDTTKIIPKGPNNIKLAGWITEMDRPFQDMTWVKSNTPNVTPPYGVAVLIDRAKTKIRALLKSYIKLPDGAEQIKEIRRILDILTISINIKLMGDWSQQEINKYITNNVLLYHDFFKKNGALWSYIISVDGLLSTSSFLCGLRSQLFRGAQHISEHRIGDVVGGHIVDKPIVFLIDNVLQLAKEDQEKSQLTYDDSKSCVSLDAKDVSTLTEKYSSRILTIVRNKIRDFDIEKIVPKGTNLKYVAKLLNSDYERETTFVYINEDRSLLFNPGRLSTKMDLLLQQASLTDNDTGAAEGFFQFDSQYSFFDKKDNTGGNHTQGVFAVDFDFYTFKKFIFKMKMKLWLNNILIRCNEIKDELTQIHNVAALPQPSVAQQDFTSDSFYVKMDDTKYVKMSDIEINMLNKILSDIKNFESSITPASITMAIEDAMNQVAKALFSYVNVEYITSLGMYDASMDMAQSTAKGWLRSKNTTYHNVYMAYGGKVAVISDNLPPSEPVVVHPDYAPYYMDSDDRQKRYFLASFKHRKFMFPKQKDKLKRILSDALRDSYYEPSDPNTPNVGCAPGAGNLFDGYFFIPFNSKKKPLNVNSHECDKYSQTIFYNFLFGDMKTNNYTTAFEYTVSPFLKHSQGESSPQNSYGYITALLNSFHFGSDPTHTMDDTISFDIQLKNNWCLLFSLENVFNQFINNVKQCVALAIKIPTSECSVSTNCPNYVGLTLETQESSATTESVDSQTNKEILGRMKQSPCSCWTFKTSNNAVIIERSRQAIYEHPSHPNFLEYKHVGHPSLVGSPGTVLEQPTPLELVSENVAALLNPLIEIAGKKINNTILNDNNELGEFVTKLEPEPEAEKISEEINKILNLCGLFKDNGPAAADISYSTDIDQYLKQFDFYKDYLECEEEGGSINNRSADYRRLQIKILRRFLFFKHFEKYCQLQGVDLIEFNQIDETKSHDLISFSRYIVCIATISERQEDGAGDILDNILSVFKKYFFIIKEKWEHARAQNSRILDVKPIYFFAYEIFDTIDASKIDKIFEKVETMEEYEKDEYLKGLLFKFLLI